MKKKLYKIIVPYGANMRIAKAMGCTGARVSQALAGGERELTTLERKIRYIALKEFNGTEMVPVAAHE